MRKLKLVVRTASGTLPLLVASTVISAEGCGEAEHSRPKENGMAGAAGNDAVGGATSSGGAGTPGTGGAVVITIPTGGQYTGPDDCSGGGCREVSVELPDEGVPAEPGQICAASMMPVVSGRAALVSFDTVEARAFTGRLTLAPGLAGRSVGTPTFQVLDATTPQLASLVFSDIQGTAEGYSFTASPASQFSLAGSDTQRISILAAFEVQCDGHTQLVHSVTDVYFCQDRNEISWASSGESCCVCRVIAEMAPSPIVPGDVDDDLPLARALRLRIVELARVSDVVVLLAEHDGGADLDYEWLATTGEVERLTPDVVVWHLREGMPDPLIQAAVVGPASAAVASFAFNDRIAS
jgi:hypothetical protein